MAEEKFEDSLNKAKEDDAKQLDVKKTRYCLCGSDDESQFMICCDYCGVWYHGACLQVTRTQANRIEIYACPPCISINSDLKITYRPKKEKQEKRKDNSEDNESSKKARKEPDSITSNSAKDLKKLCKEDEEDSNAATSSDRCNNCINCFRVSNCGKCANCEILKDPCMKRVCLQSNCSNKLHKKLANVAAAAAGSVRAKKDHIRSKKLCLLDEDDCESVNSSKSIPRSNSYSGITSNQTQLHSPTLTVATGRTKRRKPRKKDKVDSIWKKDDDLSSNENSGDDNTLRDNVYRPTGTDRTLTFEERRRIASAAYLGYTRRNCAESKVEAKHCMGPNCENSARENSKYCSDTCGMNLAKARLRFVLPDRVSDYWDRVPNSTIRSLRLLNSVEQQIKMLTKQSRAFRSYQLLMEEWIKMISNIEPSSEEDNGGTFDSDFVLGCGVCAMEFPAKQIMKHVERCFVRAERQICFGTTEKATANPYNIICNQYNKSNDTYCRRLRVICSEHYKSGAEDELKVCGYPFIWGEAGCRPIDQMFSNIESLLQKGYCRRKRKHCMQHHNWVQTALGLIDVELLSQLLKLDECFEKKRWFQVTEGMRGDVLSLMCNKRVIPSNDLERTSKTSDVTLLKQSTDSESNESFPCGNGSIQVNKEEASAVEGNPICNSGSAMEVVNQTDSCQNDSNVEQSPQAKVESNSEDGG